MWQWIQVVMTMERSRHRLGFTKRATICSGIGEPSIILRKVKRSIYMH